MVKIAYLIGNGLDIHFGLHSKYIDFYEWLKVNPKKHENNNLISDILKNIYADQTNDDEKGNWDKLTDWSDFEKELKRDLEFISKDPQANKIASQRVQNLEEVSLLLREYLQSQIQELMPLIEFNSELSAKSLSTPFMKLPPTYMELIRNRLENTFQNSPYKKSSSSINFINFNYTNLLFEYMVDCKN
ncbi:AbiH family protein [Leuconostoc mesenteroides]|uniref:AbiH family protein n=1 Tax=Leuconostoc mesenteroides TaxID=1245 RepID=UPI002361056E|nr:AbiH family protein [Leuconostoc mesenteroides]